MPHSSPEGKTQACAWIRSLAPRSVLDIGPGAGQWRQLLADLGAHWDAIEIFGPYVDRFQLLSLYDNVVIGDAATVSLESLLPSYDVAIFGDVIEHMDISTAVEMVRRIPAVHKVLSLPIVPYPQGEVEGNRFERHVATWSVDEVHKWFSVESSWAGREIGVFLLAADTEVL